MTARVYLSAAHKSSGKTTVAIGLTRALTRLGHRVAPFKKGPDYIDPLWLTAASGHACHNLDYHTMSAAEISALYERAGAGADVRVIEGNKGLFDGVALDGSNSNAALARALATPVVLVIDCRGMSRGVAPLVIGYRHFDPSLEIAGVILNRVGGARHEAKLRAVLQEYTDVPVLGAVQESADLAITERHLGLVPSGEWDGAEALIARLGEAVLAQVDVAAIARLGEDGKAPGLKSCGGAGHADVRIGIIRDRAFSFYYPGDLEALKAQGAELVFIDALRDQALPDIDGLFLGGGFPETEARALSANGALRAAIRTAIEQGLPAYAECGGLMYLTRRLTYQGETHPMVGVIAADTVMGRKPAGHGYAGLKPTAAHPWAQGHLDRGIVPAHEFHYSHLTDIAKDTVYAYEVTRGTGITGHHDGIVYKNLLAGYAHLRDVAACPWTAAFVGFVRAHRLRHAAPACGRYPRPGEVRRVQGL
ncbi:cobyrinate a,c-diamide synthase [Acidiferrobacter sp.]|uniref:cobyrinate a,c-diamide synthase n=1 Tax=Acidiferrobacter sp. TaxID=1872107 RepID=UPI0026176F61|nr:cobyrinate a,c-diamide synthase [Acidiferrobacter sp.]